MFSKKNMTTNGSTKKPSAKEATAQPNNKDLVTEAHRSRISQLISK
jgi:hypothetical protein